MQCTLLLVRWCTPIVEYIYNVTYPRAPRRMCMTRAEQVVKRRHTRDGISHKHYLVFSFNGRNPKLSAFCCLLLA